MLRQDQKQRSTGCIRILEFVRTNMADGNWRFSLNGTVNFQSGTPDRGGDGRLQTQQYSGCLADGSTQNAV